MSRTSKASRLGVFSVLLVNDKTAPLKLKTTKKNNRKIIYELQVGYPKDHRISDVIRFDDKVLFQQIKSLVDFGGTLEVNLLIRQEQPTGLYFAHATLPTALPTHRVFLTANGLDIKVLEIKVS